MKNPVKRMLICLLAMAMGTGLSKTLAQYPPEGFLSPSQVFVATIFPNGRKPITTVKNDQGIYFNIYNNDGEIVAGICAPPEGEAQYSGKFVIPDYVDYGSGDNIVKVPVVCIARQAFENSDIEELTLNNVICCINFDSHIYAPKLRRVVVPWESGIMLYLPFIGCDSVLDEIVFGKNVWFMTSQSRLYVPKLDLRGRNLILESSWCQLCTVPHIIFSSDVNVGNIAVVNFGPSRFDFVGETWPSGGYAFPEGGVDKSTLSEIHCGWITPPPYQPVEFEDADEASKEIYSKCTIYVPAGSVEAYRVAPGWKNFKNILADTEGVDGIESDRTVSSVECYDLMGRPVATPAKGTVVIERTTYSDGTTQTTRRVAR